MILVLVIFNKSLKNCYLEYIMTLNVTNNITNLLFTSDLTNGIDIRILGTYEKPWFIARDIALILEYKESKSPHTNSQYSGTSKSLAS